MANRKVVYISRLLILIICIIFIMFLSMDIFNLDLKISSNQLKFLSVFLCLILSLLPDPSSHESRGLDLLRLGLFLTIIADYIFLIHQDNYSLALGLFCLVQLIYSIRYRGRDGLKMILRFIILFLVILILYRIIDRRLGEIDFQIVLAIFYGICFGLSLWEATKRYRREPNKVGNRMIVYGMILFLLCDLNLGVHYILGVLKASGEVIDFLRNISVISIWVYYLPSQILLALSGFEY